MGFVGRFCDDDLPLISLFLSLSPSLSLPGMFVSPSMLGTRGGGSIAAAYAALLGNGESGYLSKASKLMSCSKAIQAGIDSIPELRVIGRPHMSIIAWTTRKEYDSTINIFAVGDILDKQYGFKVECQQRPKCLHITLTPPHYGVVEEFIQSQGTHTHAHTHTWL